jgi:hypothetical protein
MMFPMLLARKDASGGGSVVPGMSDDDLSSLISNERG